MDDLKLIELYWQRSENAIAETAKKYGNYCYRVAYNILETMKTAKNASMIHILRFGRTFLQHDPTDFLRLLVK